ncbi:LysM peptidoglycan-binding domain-containing protein [Anaerolineales bacterium HSG24]|nr:LysM peptidoglycan-binding domain-containing protein [Anaerolineales bacterium HSG24]
MVLLTGCELPRDSAVDDVAPVDEMPPTLAPLGAENSLQNEVVVEVATPIATVINVEPVAAVEVSEETIAVSGENNTTTNTEEAIATNSQPVNGDALEAAVLDEGNITQDATQTEEPIVVDATVNKTEEMTDNPVAANPPASETLGDYVNSGVHTVEAGDTLFGIGRKYGVSIEAIAIANNLSNDVVWIGQVLVIPTTDGYAPTAPTQEGYNYDDYSAPTYDAPSTFNEVPTNPAQNSGYHIVIPGETLYSVAGQYGTTVEILISINGIAHPYFIYVGQQLAIPTTTEYPTQQPYQQQPAPQYQQPAPQYQQPAPQYQQPVDNYSTLPGNTHTVAAGETLYSIANQYGTTAGAVAVSNGLTNPNQIYVGQVLYLP